MTRILLLAGLALGVLALAAGLPMLDMSRGARDRSAKGCAFALWVPESPASAQAGLIVISHGAGGSQYDHRGVARELARAGFFVAAILHDGDNFKDRRKAGTADYSAGRVAELRATLDALLSDPELRGKLDPTRIGALGFSVGGQTVLSSMGATIDMDAVRVHCADPARDPRFCAYGTGPNASGTGGVIRFEKDARIKAAALIAPTGAWFSAGGLDAVTEPILLRSAAADQILRAPYHADNIHLLLPAPNDYKTVPGAHHFFFIEPFPWPLKLAGFEAARDPEGLPREVPLRTVNQDVVTFFKTQLGVP